MRRVWCWKGKLSTVIPLPDNGIHSVTPAPTTPFCLRHRNGMDHRIKSGDDGRGGYQSRATTTTVMPDKCRNCAPIWHPLRYLSTAPLLLVGTATVTAEGDAKPWMRHSNGTRTKSGVPCHNHHRHARQVQQGCAPIWHPLRYLSELDRFRLSHSNGTDPVIQVR